MVTTPSTQLKPTALRESALLLMEGPTDLQPSTNYLPQSQLVLDVAPPMGRSLGARPFPGPGSASRPTVLYLRVSLTTHQISQGGLELCTGWHPINNSKSLFRRSSLPQSLVVTSEWKAWTGTHVSQADLEFCSSLPSDARLCLCGFEIGSRCGA